MKIEKLRQLVEMRSKRSYWDRGVSQYIFELIDELEEKLSNGEISEQDLANYKKVEKALLNGARNWKHYSQGGLSLVFEGDIAKRLSTPSEFKKYLEGKKPQARDWMEIQAIALAQASQWICYTCSHEFKVFLQ